MKIDLFTLIAQIVNFLLLVVFLYYVLFKKIIKVMNERQAKINFQSEEAKQNKEEAEKEKQALQKEKEAFAHLKPQLLSQAEAEIATRKQQLMQKVQEEVRKDKNQWILEIDAQKSMLFQSLCKTSTQSACMIAKGMLQEFASVELESKILEIFLDKMENFLEREKKNIAKILSEHPEEKLLISSSFPIKDSFLHQIQTLFENKIGKQIQMEWKESPHLVLGVELSMRNATISWNVAEYLHSLNESLENSFAPFVQSMSEK